jgi:hypothetical protein
MILHESRSGALYRLPIEAGLAKFQPKRLSVTFGINVVTRHFRNTNIRMMS